MVAKILKLLLFGRAMFSLVFYLWYPRYLSSGYLSACLEFDPSSVIMSRYSKEEKIRILQAYTRTLQMTERHPLEKNHHNNPFLDHPCNVF